MLEELKQQVYEANMELQKRNLIIYTWGNVSGVDREHGLVVIKPSGVPYEKLTPQMMVTVNFEGRVFEGDLNPSSDTPTHIQLYLSFPKIGGVVHTHSAWATAWAQAGIGIPCFGTTHADYFYGEVPCTRSLSKDEVEDDYELNTGKVIVERFSNLQYSDCPGVLVANHGPFTWGKDPFDAVHNCVVLEEVAKMASISRQINPSLGEAPRYLMDKHYYRKHGPGSYYGQK